MEEKALCLELPSDEQFLPQIIHLVKHVREHKNTELEVRLGTLVQKHFEPGVTYEYSSALYHDMTDAVSRVNWSTAPSACHFAYKYYKIPGVDSREAQMRLKYMNGQTHEELRVRTVQTVDLACSSRVYDLRFAVKEEIPVPGWTTSEPSTWVRSNSRCSFVHDNRWRYDFTKTGQGTTSEAACRNHTIMIELEFLPDPVYFTEHTDKEIALNLIGKARDLLGRYTQDGVRENLPLELVEKHA